MALIKTRIKTRDGRDRPWFCALDQSAQKNQGIAFLAQSQRVVCAHQTQQTFVIECPVMLLELNGLLAHLALQRRDLASSKGKALVSPVPGFVRRDGGN